MLGQLTRWQQATPGPTPRLPFKRFRIVLIKPSKYDDDGYVIRFWKGVLPSNTLSVLNGLTEEVKRSRDFGRNHREDPGKKYHSLEPAPLHQAYRGFSGGPNQSVSEGL